MRKLIYLLAFTTSLYAQEIVQLKEFEPYQRIGDTIYFNKNGYEVVKIVKPIIKKTKKKDKILGYDATYYVMLSDSIDNVRMVLTSKRLYRGIMNAPEYKKYKCTAYDNNEFDLDDNSYSMGRYITVSVEGKNCDWMPTFYVDSLMEKNDLKGGIISGTSVPYNLIPDVFHMVDSIANLLNYIENEYYYVQVNMFDSATASISPYDLCSNYQEISVANGTIDDVQRGVEKYPWPILKVHNTVTPYYFMQTVNFNNVLSNRQKTELKNGFINSVKLFEQEDSVYAMIDSFNKTTILYTVISTPEYRVANGTIKPGLVDLSEKRRADINNDGTLDLVLDSMNMPHYKYVEYIPNYPTKNKNHLSQYWYGYSTKLEYTYYLGNNYYYKVQSYDPETACLFHIENDERIDLASYQKTEVKKKVSSYQTSYIRYGRRKNNYTNSSDVVGYKYEVMINKSRKKIRRTTNPEKAVLLKQEMIHLFQYYIDHPEKLSEDFKPGKKK